ncbi:MAG: hypothetical protein JW976_04055 [Syntrophaceae bacterium]|nr:hypothetical protein [Syntrophaceae bacterium]
MAKLKKREIFLVAVAAIFVLYAVYVYLIADRQKGKKVEPSKESVKIEQVISGLTDELNKNKLSDFDNHVIRLAHVNWGATPFLKRNLYRLWLAKDGKGAEGINAVKIVYSGYVDSGKNIMAILNNIEYRIGEELMEKGYVLKGITPSKVTIFDKLAGNNLEIPIQE